LRSADGRIRFRDVSEHLLSLAAGVLPEVSPDVIAAPAAAAGYPASGIWFDPETWTNATTADVARALRSNGLIPLDIEVIWIRAGDVPTDAARRLIDAGGVLGARNVLIVSANPDPVETRHQFAALCELAEAAGMRACLEFLMISQIQTLEQALAVVGDVGHPNGGVLIDALHLQRCGAMPEDLRRVDARLLPYAQLCDGPAALSEPDHQAFLVDAVDGHSAPGEGGLPLRQLLEVLPTGIPLSLEVRSRAYRDRYPDPVDRARAVLEQTQRFLAGRAPA
jgi:sugar phosphate isomerase/epimerase